MLTCNVRKLPTIFVPTSFNLVGRCGCAPSKVVGEAFVVHLVFIHDWTTWEPTHTVVTGFKSIVFNNLNDK